MAVTVQAGALAADPDRTDSQADGAGWSNVQAGLRSGDGPLSVQRRTLAPSAATLDMSGLKSRQSRISGGGAVTVAKPLDDICHAPTSLEHRPRARPGLDSPGRAAQNYGFDGPWP